MEWQPIETIRSSIGSAILGAQIALALAFWVPAWLLIARGLDVEARGEFRPGNIVGGILISGIPFILWIA